VTAHAGEARSRAREVALQALFAADLQQRDGRSGAGNEPPASQEEHPDAPPAPSAPVPSTPDEIFASVANHFEMPSAAHDFAKHLALGVLASRDRLDEVIAKHASNWRVERMAVVDRNILRLASWELLEGGTPAAVAIDEAIELARRFGEDTSPAFVNGVLDAVAKHAGATP